jgi:hypothetical protein
MICRLYRRRKPGSVKLPAARLVTAPHNSIHLASTSDGGTIGRERRDPANKAAQCGTTRRGMLSQNNANILGGMHQW